MYNFNEIKNITTKDVITASRKTLPVIGEVDIQRVKLGLPVIKGVSAVAGTLKPN
ncbi:hypothetical protein SAMN02799633_04234 [Bacillus sp. UNCCL81]|nr:hypothetical protein SAMN02799633_04234 [Bacillus sp. UNCCL81]